MTQISIGGVDAAVSRTPSGKIRVRLNFTVEQLESMLAAAKAGADEDVSTDDPMKRTVTQCNAPESEQRREERDDGGDPRAKPTTAVFVIEGTPAWNAWLNYTEITTGRRSMPVVMVLVNGKMRDGWWKPTLFPPRIEQQKSGGE